MARNEGMLMVDALIEAKKRIAELEESLSREKADRKEAAESYPELRKELACAYEQLDQERVRAEKAEAEVERLRTFLMDEFVLDGLSTEDAAKAVHVLLKERDDG